MPNIESTRTSVIRDHVGVPAPVAEERELAERIAGPEPSDLGAVVLDPHLALVEHEEPVPGRALVQDPRTGVVLLDLEPRRDPVALLVSEGREQRHALEGVRFGVHHRSLAPAPRRDHPP